jgi:16S rRNA processing protein RimM
MQRPDNSNPNSTVKVGVISSAHGIRGQVKLHSYLANPEDIFTCPVLTDKTGRRTFAITLQGRKDNPFIVSIDGVTDRNAAEMLKGIELYGDIKSASKPKKNQWYYSDLKGLEARLSNGKIYGKVLAVYDFGAGDIIEIEFEGGKTEMLPFRESFFGEVNVKKGYLVVIPPEYVEGEPEE